MKFILLTLVLFYPYLGWAFDSTCLVDGEVCESGPQAARSSWTDGGGVWPDVRVKDEHRRIFLQSRVVGGLPDSLDESFELTIFTNGDEVETDLGSWPTLKPVSLQEALKVEVRRKTIAEFAQLPDHGYGLWDWASGFETCPLSTLLESDIEATDCHNFKTHMGPVNSNHFPPQAENFFKYYHNLALDRADVCAEMVDQVSSVEGSALNAILQCEKQALVLEAIAQHYLQDLWSSGHMWHRWGSTDLNDFDTRTQAIVVAGVAGLVHGSEAITNIPDAMCSPDDNVRHVTLRGETPLGLGDLYLHELPTRSDVENDYSRQYINLLSCTVHSLREVYGRTGRQHGPMEDSIGSSLWTPRPDWSDCTQQRATNRAMDEGLSLALPLASGVVTTLAANNFIVRFILSAGSYWLGDYPLTEIDLARLTKDLILFESQAIFFSEDDPYGTQVARNPTSLMGVGPNHEYQSDPLAPYIDPVFPWPDTTTPQPDAQQRASYLAKTFREAHAADWCQQTTLTDLETLRSRTQNPDVDHEVACEACTIAAWHHLRVGSQADYDQSREPLCHHLSDQPAYVYEADAGGLDSRSLARKWCGCSHGKVGALAINETNYLWAIDPEAIPPRAVSPCDGDHPTLNIDLGGGMQPVGASRVGGEAPGILIRFVPSQYVGWVDTTLCQEVDLDDDPFTMSTNAPVGISRFREPNDMWIMGAVGHVTESGERYMIYSAHEEADVCQSELVVVDMEDWQEVRRLTYPGHPTELMLVNHAPAISEGPSLLISMTGDPECFRAEVHGLSITQLLDPNITPQPVRFIFGGSGTQEPRRMTILSEQQQAAVTLGDDQGHIGVMDLVTGEAFVLAPGIRINDPLNNPTDVIGWAEDDQHIRWTLGQRDSMDQGNILNGCMTDFGPCPALRTILWNTTTNEEIELGVEWQGPPFVTLNFTLENTPSSDSFVVAHHRILVTIFKHLPGIHAFTVKGQLAGPGGTGVLFPYLY